MTSSPRLLERMPLVLAYSLCALLLVEVALRVAFPWDFFVWSESPFMTNMLKLENGISLYGDPGDANSFVYSPGLEYLCYGVLKPFHKHLDIRFCRLVNLAVGLAGVCCVVLFSMRLGGACLGLKSGRQTLLWLAPFALLLAFKNFTAEVTHPDNLHILHLFAVACLCLLALEKRSCGLALLAIVLGSLGVWLKQTAALSAVGASLALVCAGQWGKGRSFLLLFLGTGTTFLAIWGLFQLHYGRFYLFDLLSAHQLEPKKLVEFFQKGNLYQILLLYLLPLALLQIRKEQTPWRSPALIVWLCLGIFEALPALSAFCKINGSWNNLSVVNLWLFVLVGPFLIQKERSDLLAPNDTTLLTALRPLSLGLFLVCLAPTKLPPLPAHYRHCTELDHQVGADLAAHRSVLLAHGTMPLIHNGWRGVPLDRANSYVELRDGARHELAHTRARIEQGYYDSIYLNSGWYTDDIKSAIARHYQLVGEIKSPRGQPGYLFGFQGLMGTVKIYRKTLPPHP